MSTTGLTRVGISAARSSHSRSAGERARQPAQDTVKQVAITSQGEQARSSNCPAELANRQVQTSPPTAQSCCCATHQCPASAAGRCPACPPAGSWCRTCCLHAWGTIKRKLSGARHAACVAASRTAGSNGQGTTITSCPAASPARYLARAERVRRARQLSASMSATWRSEGASTALAQLCSTLTPISLPGRNGTQPPLVTARHEA